jgi:HEAT repeat protein
VALAARQVDEGVSSLLEHVERRTDLVPEGIRTVPLWQAAIPFLGIAGDSQAVPALMAVLHDKEAPLDALIATLRSLGQVGDVRAIPAIRAFLQRTDLPTERVFHSPPDVDAATEDVRWQLELVAAEALSRLGASRDEVCVLVEPYLWNERAYVRRYAYKVLDEAGGGSSSTLAPG